MIVADILFDDGNGCHKNFFLFSSHFNFPLFDCGYECSLFPAGISAKKSLIDGLILIFLKKSFIEDGANLFQIPASECGIGNPQSAADLKNRFFFWSTLHGRWVDDSASEWINDENLTQKCLEIPLDLIENNPVDVRDYFSWFSSSGFVYIDPALELEPVVSE